ncbi:MAG: hypothetical protein OXE87_10975 [Chloroflexi bacterium]|nr:hypothetical protein [Chloroflexota bacterium]
MLRASSDAAEVLDAAISNAAATTFDRLTRGLNRTETAVSVSHALDSLHGSIRRLETPEYAEALVALFYSVWYQPFQTNLAYSLIFQAIEEREAQLSSKRRLDIVDFGSGTLASGAGLALAVLEAQARGVPVPGITVALVEPSDAMTRTGPDIWGSFLAANGHDVRVDLVACATEGHLGTVSISLQRVEDVCDIEMAPDSDRWLVAMHTYYGASKEGIKRDLARIGEVFEPEIGLFTCHYDNVAGVCDVSPFAGPAMHMPIPPLRMAGELPRVTQWRRRLAEELGLSDDPRLTRPTEWDPERGYRDNRAALFYSD